MAWTLFLLAGFFLFAFQAGFFHVTCVDPGFHIRTGELVLQTHSIPSRNTFSFTMPDHPWLLHQWAPGVLFYLAYRSGGLAGLIGFKALLGAIVMLAAWLCARRETGRGSYWPFWAATLGVMLARPRFFERPYMFSGILLALLYYLGQRFRGSRRWEWVGLPLFMALWANVHVGVLDGYVLLGVFVLADTVEALGRRPVSRDALGGVVQLGVGIALSLAAALAAVWIVNPSGPRVLFLPVTYFLSPFWHEMIAEFHAPTWQAEKLFFIALAATLLLQVFVGRRRRWRLFLPALVIGLFTCRSQRLILPFAVVLTPLLAQLLDSLAPDRSDRARRVHRAALPAAWVALFLLVVVRDPTFRYGVGLYPGYHPVSMYRFIRERVPPQNLYHDMMYGAGVLWWLHPDFKPFIDGRCEAYSEEFWRQYVPLSQGKTDWRGTFREYHITGALIPNRLGKPLAQLARQLRADADWALVAFNDQSVLFLQRTEANREVIAREEYRLIWPGDWSLETITEKTAPAAAVEARRALALEPDGLFARTALARASMLAGQYAEAVSNYTAIVASRDASPRYWRELAYSLYMAGRMKEVGATTDYMLEANVEPAFALYLKHFLALQRGEAGEARELLRQAIARDPAEPSYAASLRELEAAPGRPEN